MGPLATPNFSWRQTFSICSYAARLDCESTEIKSFLSLFRRWSRTPDFGLRARMSEKILIACSFQSIASEQKSINPSSSASLAVQKGLDCQRSRVRPVLLLSDSRTPPGGKTPTLISGKPKIALALNQYRCWQHRANSHALPRQSEAAAYVHATGEFLISDKTHRQVSMRNTKSLNIQVFVSSATQS